jgi:hypothetical protein
MCILVICETRKMSKNEFNNCYDSNPDGVGFSWNDGKNVFYEKGFISKSEAWSFYKENLNSFPHVAHFRIQTSGGVCRELTHPFLVNKDSSECLKYSGQTEALFHNGIMPEWKNHLLTLSIQNGKMPDGKISDTRVLAMLIARLGTNVIDYVLGSGKVAIVNKTDVFYWGDFEKERGVLFSNAGYKKYKITETCGGQQWAPYWETVNKKPGNDYRRTNPKKKKIDYRDFKSKDENENAKTISSFDDWEKWYKGDSI